METEKKQFDPLTDLPKTAEEFRDSLIVVGMMFQTPIHKLLELYAESKAQKNDRKIVEDEEKKARDDAPWEYVVISYEENEVSRPPSCKGTGWKVCETRSYTRRKRPLAILWGREVQDD